MSLIRSLWYDAVRKFYCFNSEVLKYLDVSNYIMLNDDVLFLKSGRIYDCSYSAAIVQLVGVNVILTIFEFFKM